MFVSRTAKSTTKENVEACLEYFTGIKGTATCVTPEERIQSAFSLSWRVEVAARDLERALQASSWVTGWGVREYFFPRQKKSKPAEFKVPTLGGIGASQIPTQSKNGGNQVPAQVTNGGSHGSRASRRSL